MSSSEVGVHLSFEEADALGKSLSTCRHNINNCLSLILSAMELAELKPDTAPRMIQTAVSQSKEITEEMVRFSQDFERIMMAARSHGVSR